MAINRILWRWVGVALLCLGLLSGCSKPSTVESAMRTMDAFFAAIKAQDFEQAGTYFLDSVTRSRRQWVEELLDYHEKLGELQSYTLQNKIINTVYSGMRYTLTYKVKYSKHEAVETFILFEGVSEENVHIEVMRVQSPAL